MNMSIWKTTMTWLGLGPDAEYEQTGESSSSGFSDPAFAPETRGSAANTQPSGAVRGPIGPMTEHDHNDFSAVRSLGPMSDADNEYGSERNPAPDVRPLTNTSLRPVEVTRASEPPMGSVQAVPAGLGSRPQIVAPRSFNDAQAVADRFRGGAAVILNLQETDAVLGRRLIDFCSGLCYGLRGQMERVGDRVFLVTPADVQLTADDHRLMRDSGLLG
jgi:cell division inhibitor SepF